MSFVSIYQFYFEVKEVFLIRPMLFGFIVIIGLAFSCTSVDRGDNRYLDEASEAFFDYKLYERASMVKKVEFKGPILKNRIEDFPKDLNYKVYAWYHVHEKDTFWVYCEVDKELEREPTVHFSANYDKLLENWPKWYSEEPRTED